MSSAAAPRSDTVCLVQTEAAGGGLKEKDTRETHEAASALIQHCLGQDKTEGKSYVTHRTGVYQGRQALVSTKESILANARDGGAGRECKRVKWATPFAQHSDKRLIITPAAEL